MKKALFVLLAVALLSLSAFAQVTATGTVGFSFGNSDLSASEPQNPYFTTTKSATATVALKTTDEKVNASIGLNLLALPTVVTTLSTPAKIESYYDPQVALNYSTWDTWSMIKNLISVYTANSGTYKFQAADWDKIVAALKANKWKSGKTWDNGTTKTATNVNDPVAADLKAAGDINDFNTKAGLMLADLKTLFDNMVKATLKDAADTNVKAIANMLTLKNYLAGLYVPANAPSGVWEGLAAADKTALKAAADATLLYDNANFKVTYKYTADNTLTSNFISSASLSFPKVLGVVDITALLSGAHASAGSINADMSGHQSDAVASYQGIKFGLSDGVVPGLSAGVTLWDDASARALATDTWYTIFKDEGAAVEPTIAFGVNAGYTLALGDAGSAGISAEVAKYGTDDLALSLKPSFSGFGATLTGEYAMMGTTLSYITANVGYAIMGITPSVTFYNVKGPIVYNGSALSVIDNLKNVGGTGIGAGIGVDLKALASLPIAASINFSLLDDITNTKMGWNAGASVTPMDNLTVALTAGHDDVNGGDSIDYSASVSFKYSIATITAKYGTAYNNGGGEYRAFYSLGTSVTF